MKKTRLLLGTVALILALALAAGCGSNNSKAQQPQPQQQSHDQMDMSGSMNMPKGNPTPVLKDLDKNLQDMTRQIKAGQTMDAQKSAAQIAGLADKLLPHMMDTALKDRFRQAAYDLRDTMNNGKADQTVVEGKLKTLQALLAPVTKDLQSMTHN